MHRQIADTHVYFVATRQEKKKLLACNIAQGRSGVTAPVFWGLKRRFLKKSLFFLKKITINVAPPSFDAFYQ
jgi:hypothetical protein